MLSHFLIRRKNDVLQSARNPQVRHHQLGLKTRKRGLVTSKKNDQTNMHFLHLFFSIFRRKCPITSLILNNFFHTIVFKTLTGSMSVPEFVLVWSRDFLAEETAKQSEIQFYSLAFDELVYLPTQHCIMPKRSCEIRTGNLPLETG